MEETESNAERGRKKTLSHKLETSQNKQNKLKLVAKEQGKIEKIGRMEKVEKCQERDWRSWRTLKSCREKSNNWTEDGKEKCADKKISENQENGHYFLFIIKISVFCEIFSLTFYLKLKLMNSMIREEKKRLQQRREEEEKRMREIERRQRRDVNR